MRASREGIGNQVLELSRLVAAESQGGEIVALDQDARTLRRPAQRLPQARGIGDRCGKVSERIAGKLVHLLFRLPTPDSRFPTPDHCPYTTFPPTIVRVTLVVRISSSGMVRMSLDSTVMSASLPTASDPFSVSSFAAYAAFQV